MDHNSAPRAATYPTEDDPEFAKRQRKSERASFTRVVSKIRKLIAERGSRTKLRILKEELDDHYRDCIASNDVFANSPQVSTADRARAADWGRDLNAYQATVFAEINSYFSSRAGSAASIMSTTSEELDETSAMINVGSMHPSIQLLHGDIQQPASSINVGGLVLGYCSPVTGCSPTRPAGASSPVASNGNADQATTSAYTNINQSPGGLLLTAPDTSFFNSSIESASTEQAPPGIHPIAGASTATGLFSVANYGSATTGYAPVGPYQIPGAPTMTTSAFSTTTDAGRNLTGPAPVSIITVSSSHSTAPNAVQSTSIGRAATAHAPAGLSPIAGASTATGLFSLAKFGSASTGYAPVGPYQIPGAPTMTTSALSTTTDAGRNLTGPAPVAIITVSSSHSTAPNVVHSTSIGQAATAHAPAGLSPMAGASTATGLFSLANFGSAATGYAPVGSYQIPGAPAMTISATSTSTDAGRNLTGPTPGAVSGGHLTAPNGAYSTSIRAATEYAPFGFYSVPGSSLATVGLASSGHLGSAAIGHAPAGPYQLLGAPTMITSALSATSDANLNLTGPVPATTNTISSGYSTAPNVALPPSIGYVTTGHAPVVGSHPIVDNSSTATTEASRIPTGPTPLAITALSSSYLTAPNVVQSSGIAQQTAALNSQLSALSLNPTSSSHFAAGAASQRQVHFATDTNLPTWPSSGHSSSAYHQQPASHPHGPAFAGPYVRSVGPASLHNNNFMQYSAPDPFSQNYGFTAPVHYAYFSSVSNRFPNIKVEPFDGNPRNLSMFMSSFKSLVHDELPNDALRLAALRELLSPSVREAIADSLYDPHHYQLALHRLNEEFGQPFIVAQAHINTMLSLPAVKNNDSQSLRAFSAGLHGAVAALLHSGHQYELASSGTLKQLVIKLPPGLRDKWGLRVYDMQPNTPSIVDLDNWLRRLSKSTEFSMAASVISADTIKAGNAKMGGKKAASQHAVNSAVTTQKDSSAEPRSPPAYRCLACEVSPPHRIRDCQVFIALSPTQRYHLVKKESRCVRCITGRHKAAECERQVQCEIDDCSQRHHPLLHGAEGLHVLFDATPEEALVAVGFQKPHHSFSAVLHQVAPVIVYSENGKTRVTYAFLDSGSDATFITANAAKELGLRGPKTKLCFGTFLGSGTDIATTVVKFKVGPLGEEPLLDIPQAYTVPDLNLPRPPLDWSELKRKWEHVADLALPVLGARNIELLIGINVPAAHEQLEFRKPDNKETGPIAIRTPLGWSIAGPIERSSTVASRCVNVGFSQERDESFLDESLERLWSTEAFGVSTQNQPISADDTRALQILERTIVCVERRYVVGLMWRSPSLNLPDNRDMALRRLYSLENHFRRDHQYALRYQAVVEEYVSSGHARLVTQDELDVSPPWSWHLPHHGVINPNKPEKIRVVFDASAEFQGMSLNRALYKGPDLLTSLLGVLLRFRVHPITLISDIEKMYHQVLVHPADQPALRFLWRTPGSNAPVSTYQMKVHVFGAVSSPTTCLFALARTAADNRVAYPDGERLIRQSFYVDNYLDSVETEAEAIRNAENLTQLLRLGGFRLTKWLSSSRLVLSTIPVEERALPTLNLDFDALPIERTLGMLYCSQHDAFSFKISISSEVSTRRNLLSELSRIYDPLGFLAPLVLPMKILLQDVCRLSIKWDDQLPVDVVAAWTKWAQEILQVQDLQLQRCLRRLDLQPSSRSLHVFTDASETAFCAVAYLRSTYSDGTVSTGFIMAKARVAPLKQLSIPRLELQGALLGLRLAVNICSELRLQIAETTFWTDSQTVLQWIHSATCRFHVFVAHRIGEILSNSSRQQWRHIPGTMNPADDASRGLPASDLSADHRWLAGPHFLMEEESTWPASGTFPEPEDDEIKLSHWTMAVYLEPSNVVMEVLDKFSSLQRVLRVLAWIKRFVLNCKAKRNAQERTAGPLTVAELQDAKLWCVKTTQRAHFSSELESLSKRRVVHSDSRLLKLAPFLDANEIIRVGGRLDQASVAYDFRHPIVIPDSCRFAELVIWYHHLVYPVRNAHLKTERLLADIRAEFWILRGRQVVKAVLNRCIPCKKMFAQPLPPFMASLPAVRLEPRTYAFINVGVDYMGPFVVKIGRRNEKRWICLFTCLVVRAVHLEIAHRLDADSFLQCFQRFIDRRGYPSSVCSDNGTNLAAGERELREGLQHLDQARISDSLASRNIKWHFSPPAGPHFGGAWERLVRSSKVALRAILGSRSVADEVLHTVVTDVEALLNARPLTHLSVDPSELEPLTPNHFLLGRANPHLPLDFVDESEVVSRRKFRAIQAMMDQFWRRWMVEYTPHLTERKKWLAHRRNLQLGDIVLIVDSNSPRGSWPVGRITSVKLGVDGIVRSATVQTASGSLERPVVKLCVLETTTELSSVIGTRAGDVTE